MRSRIIVLVILSAMIAACVSAPSHSVPPSADNLRYSSGQSLPSHLGKLSNGCEFDDEPVLDSFTRKWYQKHFSAAGENALTAYRVDDSSRQVRFTWLRSFDEPVIVHLIQSGESAWKMDAVLLSGRGGYDPGRPEQRIEIFLSDKQGARMEDLLARGAATSRPGSACKVSLDEHGNKQIVFTADGAQWIVETLDGNGYEFIDVQSPDSGTVKELGLFLWN